MHSHAPETKSKTEFPVISHTSHVANDNGQAPHSISRHGFAQSLGRIHEKNPHPHSSQPSPTKAYHGPQILIGNDGRPNLSSISGRGRAMLCSSKSQMNPLKKSRLGRLGRLAPIE